MESPERKSLATKWARIPARWQDEGLRAEVVRAANAAALTRQISERLAAARSACTAALAATLSAEDPDLDVLVAAHREVTAAEALAATPVPAALDVSVVRPVHAAAMSELDGAMSGCDLEPTAYARERALWRTLGPLDRANIEPPAATIAEVELYPAYRRISGRIALWFQSRQSLADNTGGRADVLDWLGSAASLIEQVGEIAAMIAEYEPARAAAASERTRAGLTWHLPASVSTEMSALSVEDRLLLLDGPRRFALYALTARAGVAR